MSSRPRRLSGESHPRRHRSDRPIRDLWASEAPDTFSQGDNRWERLHQNHAFIVTEVDRDAGTVTVVNPWDPTQGPIVLTEDELVESINGVRVNEAP